MVKRIVYIISKKFKFSISSFKIYLHMCIWDPFNKIAIRVFISKIGKFSGQRHW